MRLIIISVIFAPTSTVVKRYCNFSLAVTAEDDFYIVSDIYH